MRNLNEIIIHHSASGWGDTDVIRDWHTSQGWSDIGYHFVALNGILRSESTYNKNIDGVVEKGRDIEIIGAHVFGHNEGTVGICLIGNGKHTPRQIIGAVRLCVGLMDAYGIESIKGHKEYDAGKALCPSFDMDAFRTLVDDSRLRNSALSEKVVLERFSEVTYVV